MVTSLEVCWLYSGCKVISLTMTCIFQEDLCVWICSHPMVKILLDVFNTQADFERAQDGCQAIGKLRNHRLSAFNATV